VPMGNEGQGTQHVSAVLVHGVHIQPT